MSTARRAPFLFSVPITCDSTTNQTLGFFAGPDRTRQLRHFVPDRGPLSEAASLLPGHRQTGSGQ
jgi:hypothetical protein